MKGQEPELVTNEILSQQTKRRRKTRSATKGISVALTPRSSVSNPASHLIALLQLRYNRYERDHLKLFVLLLHLRGHPTRSHSHSYSNYKSKSLTYEHLYKADRAYTNSILFYSMCNCYCKCISAVGANRTVILHRTAGKCW